LAQLTGGDKSNLSRTLKTMAGNGMVTLERGERGRIAAKVVHEQVVVQVPLVWKQYGRRHRRRRCTEWLARSVPIRPPSCLIMWL
jgi:predicted transcriptional regulator